MEIKINRLRARTDKDIVPGIVDKSDNSPGRALTFFSGLEKKKRKHPAGKMMRPEKFPT
ncbi:MAG: hypothetical protein WC834_00320 [Eubacteriales bacterium]